MIRFDYGSVVPWVRRVDGALSAIAGPNALRIDTPVDLRGEDLTTVGEVAVSAGDRVPFVLTWYPSHLPAPEPVDAEEALEQHGGLLARVVRRAASYDGAWAEPVRTLDPDAQGAHLRADRRDRRRADDLAAGVDRRACGTGTTGIAGCGTRR